jgi:hypothetical protein
MRNTIAHTIPSIDLARVTGGVDEPGTFRFIASGVPNEIIMKDSPECKKAVARWGRSFGKGPKAFLLATAGMLTTCGGSFGNI